MSRVVELPDRGQLIVATDLQGHLRDFERIAEIFEQAAGDKDGAYLVITGDLVHGPEISREQWPEYLGSYYTADSSTVLLQAEELLKQHPGRVFYLMGNHEHAHIGGPVVSKFFADEALRLEEIIGAKRTQALKRWIASWPLIALARHAGVLMLHAAPNAVIKSPEDIERLHLSPYPARLEALEELEDLLLADLLWARTTTAARARGFLRAFDKQLRVAVYGHDVVREGFAIDREPLLCLSTSFGCYDGDKLYLQWDLSQPAQSARDLAARGLRPLYPDIPPIYRFDTN